MSQDLFIKPISKFEDGKLEGADVIGSGQYWWDVTVAGQTFKVTNYIWNNAFERNGFVKLGQKCRVYDSIPTTQPIPTRNTQSQFNPETVSTTLLSSVNVDQNLYRPIKTGTFIDGFWSRKGGIMPGTNTMVTGDPGIGKSSVMMDVLQGIKVTNPGKKVLYVSAEMTRIDMLDPDEFMKYYPNLFDKVEFLFAGDFIDDEGGPSFSQALEVVLSRGYDVVVFDSMIEVQSIFQEEMGLSSGKQAEKYMLNLMQKHNQAQNDRNVYTAFLLIQQVKKDGEFVGSRRLEHMITAFLRIKWDDSSRGKKYMEFRKNRRGANKLRLYFKLGNGVEYDESKFESELRLMDIMGANEDIVGELSQAELAQLFIGKKTDVEEEN